MPRQQPRDAVETVGRGLARPGLSPSHVDRQRESGHVRSARRVGGLENGGAAAAHGFGPDEVLKRRSPQHRRHRRHADIAPKPRFLTRPHMNIARSFHVENLTTARRRGQRRLHFPGVTHQGFTATSLDMATRRNHAAAPIFAGTVEFD
ncbi:hypothetical protein NL676_020078 [Syzygium grande]|nr:hypothetical protein NL676_020078 [Syzygium grande]